MQSTVGHWDKRKKPSRKGQNLEQRFAVGSELAMFQRGGESRVVGVGMSEGILWGNMADWGLGFYCL